MPFSVCLADQSDIPTLAQIANQASQLDAHTQLKQRYGGYDHRATMAEALQIWLARPPQRCRVVKAVDDDSHTVLGWVAWGLRGYDDAVTANTDALAMTNSNPTPIPDTAIEQSENSVIESSNETLNIQESSNSGITRLGALTDADLQRWMGIFMPPGTKCMFLHSIVVHPSHRSRGVGSALLRYGTQQADRDGVFCWVHSVDSDAAIATFAKAGFREVGRLSLDLDEFAREEREKKVLDGVGDLDAGAEYGVYTFRYMKREPIAPTNTDVQRAGVT